MAAGAVIGEGTVINVDLGPVSRYMTAVASPGGGNVARRFTRRFAAVMTTGTGAGRRGVIHAD